MNKKNNPILRLIDGLSSLCGFAAAMMILAAILITCQMIFVRYVLNQSTIWQTEAVVYLMIAATMIGLPYVQRLRGHVNVNLLPLMLPMALRKMLAYLTLGASTIVLLVMFYYGFELWLIAFERGWRSDTVWGLRLWIPYLALPLGFGLFVLQILGDVYAIAIGADKPFDHDRMH